jgi:hypothetical protein
MTVIYACILDAKNLPTRKQTSSFQKDYLSHSAIALYILGNGTDFLTVTFSLMFCLDSFCSEWSNGIVNDDDDDDDGTISKAALLSTAINAHLDTCKDPNCHIRLAMEEAEKGPRHSVL